MEGYVSTVTGKSVDRVDTNITEPIEIATADGIKGVRGVYNRSQGMKTIYVKEGDRISIDGRRTAVCQQEATLSVPNDLTQESKEGVRITMYISQTD